MRILFIDRYLGGHDGPGIYLYDLFENLIARGHQIALAYGRKVGDYFPRGLTTYFIPGLYEERYGTAGARRALLRAIETFRPEVASAQCLDILWFAEDVSRYCPLVWNLLTHAITCPNWTRLYGRDLSICTVDFGPHCAWHNFADRCGSPNPKALAENMLRVAAARACLRHVDALQALTPYMRETIERAGVPKEKIFDIPVYAPFFDEKRTYTPPSRPLILYVGRLHPTKGPHLLLDACQKLKADFELAIVGGGPMAEELEDRVEAMGLKDRCRFYITNIESQNARAGKTRTLITREEMSRLYLDAALVVFPSVWAEPSGIVRLEAMAHGRPLIGFDSGGTAHCIVDGVTGFVVPRLDVDLLAARIEAILRDPALGERMGRAALEYVKEHYHPAKLTREMEEVLGRLIQRRREGRN